MEMFPITLLVAAFLCTLVAGVVFAFAAVVMPGIRQLGDDDFLRAFQVIDQVIQKGQPFFMLVWVGSALALIGAAALGFGQLDGTGRGLLVTAVVVYLLGVQLPTAAINIPLNNRLQEMKIEDLNPAEQAATRRGFEGRWNAANLARTVLACVVSVLLSILLLRL
ncbi:MAG: DUF1772 domain-containing protein [Planctomycetota bacterium]